MLSVESRQVVAHLIFDFCVAVPGGHVQGPATTGTSTVQGSNCAGEVGQVLVGQRAYLEHPQVF